MFWSVTLCSRWLVGERSPPRCLIVASGMQAVPTNAEADQGSRRRKGGQQGAACVAARIVAAKGRSEGQLGGYR